VGIVVGNVIGSATVPLLGVPQVFFIPAALCAVSLLMFLAIERASRHSLTHATGLAPASR
jgi:predicted MFS family arabinose efflux permease